MAAIAVHRRFQRLAGFAVVGLIFTYMLLNQMPEPGKWRVSWGGYRKSSFDWASRPRAHPIDESTMTQLPQGPPHILPRIQHDFSHHPKDEAMNKTLTERREAVVKAARKSWGSYRKYAWGRDELVPESLKGFDTFNGWGATLVDSLDTLWIMGLRKEFQEAVVAVGSIDWNKTEAKTCSLFETNIRYLGGLLSAYDLSKEKTLLMKAVELGEMLYTAFDTPNHFPVNNLEFGKAIQGKLVADKHEMSASVGSLGLEFTRLSQLTGDQKYFSAVDRIKRELDRTQDTTCLPGMWPAFIDLKNGFKVQDKFFSIGAMADSAYEYLGKMYLLLGGLDPIYEKLHVGAMETIKKHILFRPMLPDNYPEGTPDILFSGTVLSDGTIIERTDLVQHLGCYAGGMYAIGGKLFNKEEDVVIGEKIARGCAWMYSAFPTGIMPEQSALISCDTPNLGPCAWNESKWRAVHADGPPVYPMGFANVRDPQYHLRPEAIESLFILYRITAKKDLLDIAWRMFEAIVKATETPWAYSGIRDVRASGTTVKTDSMESFWTAETLKYFYLIFSEPEVMSLDDWVFNTEAHPLRIPKPVTAELRKELAS